MSIENEIRKIAAKDGYLYIDEMMRVAMNASDASYYRSCKPIGADADFITSPEISQLFGEMIGMWCYNEWERLGKPNPVNLIELGPGRGVLMRDLLRATKSITGFHDALQIQMLEISPHLKREQVQHLKGYKASWIEDVSEIFEMPTIIVANEFFDALPIRQYVKVKNEWREIVIVIDPKDDMLKFDSRVIPKVFNGRVDLDHIKVGDGVVIEESQKSIEIIHYIATHIKEYGGAALIIDYGYYIDPKFRQDHQFVSTLQAVSKHKFAPLLKSLGEVDLSAHVDFYALSQVAKARSAEVAYIRTQGEFLISLGIMIRLDVLKAKNPKFAEILDRQVCRLISDEQMGELFKVMEIRS